MSDISSISGITRRRLLQMMALSPLLTSLPALSASRPDLSRIVTLEWLPTELLIALGVMPLAIADIRNYNIWVAEPPLGPGVIDVGQRTEPNMELIQQLNPSLLLITTGYGPTTRQLETIAPVLDVKANDGSAKPLNLAISSLHKLADRLGLQDRAEAHLQLYRNTLKQTREQLKPVAHQPLLLITFIDTRHVLVFGVGSMFHEVMGELGLTNAWVGEGSFWGSVSVGVERLASIKNARVLCFEHDNTDMMDAVAKTPLWKSMPFVRANQFSIVPAVWYYGATFSAMNFCEMLTRTLRKPV
ncbi:periplasmic substrate-binding component of an ABC superfamily ferric hydroxamate transporter [Rahnella aquatilis CIP 78.65 = ATCC 33071]|uniref:ABC-type Fe3+-hydroxamate transport system, periplasmic component n=1 Tax=Rahnella aquatilis (strain ATCC 33071 / DSM 4594 / JCM 1683 / NBRC 105701 / NCIMB 13365 / CIP 78.65) TaxID=745277 RepID=H2IQ85_RAHAC|nr:Fe(3+)-hydroxamate ABC transporter substrate-binding protein FhuD [Rahnella aquatilis]AEX53524.1 ABC-type Fe3+-hydroxamate transport system, periplasmic component [Rahnella aquatilis CIP 78.65 = ATCC 33071]KFD03281.1 periplasmic substrate-binding component of an ABC superfamily ferric hydroxamate transporter [Rahnella aquatilis CIP 78.65 = ATCC 33071]